MIRGRFSSIFTRRRNTGSLALRSPLAQFENESFVELNDDPFKTEIRKLAIDKFRSFTLVTRPSRHGTHTTVGLCFPAGSRHTDAFSAGISHLDQALAFGKCSSFQSRDEIRERDHLDKCGAIFDAQSDHETTIYALSIMNKHVNDGIKVLFDTAFQPLLTENCVEEALASVENELKHNEFEPVRVNEICELSIHAGFNHSKRGMGNKRSMHERIAGSPRTIAREVADFRSANYFRKDPVIVAVGMDMEELVESVKPVLHLAADPSYGVSESVPAEPSVWTGGCAHLVSGSSSFSILGDDSTSQTYSSIAWEAPSINDPDRYTCHVLRAMLGGQSYFESGGPGKGITSLLCTQILANPMEQNIWNHFKAIYKEFEDAGSFIIFGQGGENCEQLAVNNGILMLERISKGSYDGWMKSPGLMQSKNQLLNSYLRDLEIKAEMMEIFAKETVSLGAPQNPNHIVKQIDKVSIEDVKRMARKLLESDPAVAVLGPTTDVESLLISARERQSSKLNMSWKLKTAASYVKSYKKMIKLF